MLKKIMWWPTKWFVNRLKLTFITCTLKQQPHQDFMSSVCVDSVIAHTYWFSLWKPKLYIISLYVHVRYVWVGNIISKRTKANNTALPMALFLTFPEDNHLPDVKITITCRFQLLQALWHLRWNILCAIGKSRFSVTVWIWAVLTGIGLQTIELRRWFLPVD